MPMSEKYRRKFVNQEIPSVYPFPGYCSRNIKLFFEKE